MDDDFSERLKALKREIRELSEDVEALRKRKANGDDVEQVSAKVTALESELRTKFATMHSDSQEIRNGLRMLIEAVDQLKVELNHHKRDIASELTDKQKGGVWERIPKWAYLLMGVGLLSLMQQGPALWAQLQGLR